MRLAVLVTYEADADPYHRQVVESASDEVNFLCAIYDSAMVQSLRFHSAGLSPRAHSQGQPPRSSRLWRRATRRSPDNKYNRWVAGDAAVYFSCADDAAEVMDQVIEDSLLRRELSANVVARWEAEFTWEKVAGQYEALLLKRLVPRTRRIARKG